MKRTIRRMLSAWMAVLLVMCITPALAQEDALPDLLPLEQLLDALTDTMYNQGLHTFDSATAETPTVAYGLIWRLTYRGQLDVQPVDGVVTLTAQQLAAVYHQLFAQGAFVLPAEDCCDMITRTEDGLAFDVSTAAAGRAGMQITLVTAEENGVQQLLLELYYADADYYAAQPEDLLTADWYGSALVTVQRDEAAPFGWRILAWTEEELGDAGLEPDSTAPALQAYTQADFTVMYPAAVPASALTVTDTGMSGRMDELNFSVTTRTVPQDTTLAAVQAEMILPADAQVEQAPGGLSFTVMYQEGTDTVVRVVSVAAGQAAELTLRYPTADMELYAAYADGMANSFALTGVSVG